MSGRTKRPKSALEGLRPLSAAEEEIIAELHMGTFDRLGDGSRPAPGDVTRAVRADFLRFLILGGDDDHRPHEKGVRVTGAWITGVLDLEGCRVPRDIGLKDCQFDAVPVLRSAIIDNLFLDGSELSGLQADRLEARGGLSLRGALIKGEIRLTGARLGGYLDCHGTTLDHGDGVVLSAEGLETRGGVFLRGATVRGGISLPDSRHGADLDGVGLTIDRPGKVALDCDGIEVRGDVMLRNAKLSGETRFVGAHVGGNFDCSAASCLQPGGDAIRLEGATVEGALVLRQGATIRGALNLTSAVLGAIDDARDSWPGTGDLLLNRCRYGAFIGGPVDSESRLEWLGRQVPRQAGEDFWPQPYEQLSGVFRGMGHDEDARAVLIAKERLQRRARRARAGNVFLRAVLWATDAILGVTIRYGRQPLIAIFWLLAFWAIGVVVFGMAERNNALKPNSPVILRSPEWTLCAITHSERQFQASSGQYAAGRAEKGQPQLACFHNQPEAASYPEFNRWMYSMDALLPVLEVGQKQYWRPDPSKPTGPIALNYYYLQTLVGWVLSLLAVAGFSGLVKSA